MYERTGMGWSELTWWEKARMLGIACNVEHGSTKPRSVCFKNTPQDIEIANLNRCVRYPGGHCERDGVEGQIWCCPEGYPRDYLERIPPEVSAYEEERRRWLEQEPQSQQPQQPQATLPPAGDPVPVSQHTFFTRLSHPGALAALGLLAGGGVLFFLAGRRNSRRYF